MGADTEAESARAAATTRDASTLDLLAVHPAGGVRAHVAKNPATPRSALSKLATDVDDRVRASVAGHPSTPLDAVERWCADPSRVVRKRAWARSDLPTELLIASLGESRQDAAIRRLVERSQTDPTVVSQLLACEKGIAWFVAARCRLDPESARTLWDRRRELQYLPQPLAENPTLPVAVLRRLLGEQPHLASVVHPDVVSAPGFRRSAFLRGNAALLGILAAQPSTRAGTLVAIRLRRHRAVVTRAVAANPNTPKLLLWRLSWRWQRWDVRARVAANPSCPTWWRNRLAVKDEDWAVAAAALTRSDLRGETLTRMSYQHPGVVKLVAAHPNTPAATVEHLAARADPFIRSVAMRHPSLGVERITALAADLAQPAWMLRSLALNPSCPPALAEQLLTWITIGGVPNSDPTFDALTEVGHPGNTTVPLATTLLALANDLGGPSHALAIVRRRYFDGHPRLPHADLLLLARDPDVEVRRRAARFTWLTTMSELGQDAAPFVADTAKRLRASTPWKPSQRVKHTRTGWWGTAGGLAVLAALFGTVLNQRTPDGPSPADFTLPFGFTLDQLTGPMNEICSVAGRYQIAASDGSGVLPDTIRVAAVDQPLVVASANAVGADATTPGIDPALPLIVLPDTNERLTISGRSSPMTVTGRLLVDGVEVPFTIRFPHRPGSPPTGSC